MVVRNDLKGCLHLGGGRRKSSWGEVAERAVHATLKEIVALKTIASLMRRIPSCLAEARFSQIALVAMEAFRWRRCGSSLNCATASQANMVADGPRPCLPETPLRN